MLLGRKQASATPRIAYELAFRPLNINFKKLILNLPKTPKY